MPALISFHWYIIISIQFYMYLYGHVLTWLTMVLPNHLRNYDMDKLWHRRKIQVITYSCSDYRRTISAYTPQMAYVCWWPSSSLVLKAARTHAVAITTQNTQLMSIIHHRKYFTTIIIFLEQGLVKYVHPVRAWVLDHISIKFCIWLVWPMEWTQGLVIVLWWKLQFVCKLIYLLSFKFLPWYIIHFVEVILIVIFMIDIIFCESMTVHCCDKSPLYDKGPQCNLHNIWGICCTWLKLINNAIICLRFSRETILSI